jgi:integrase
VVQPDRRPLTTYAGKFEKDTLKHQQRRVVLDEETTALLREHKARAEAKAAEFGAAFDDSRYILSLAPDHSTFIDPSSTTQRYERMSKRLNIDSTIHKLRHYSATELLNAGVNIRAVAGRLGHGGGGATTLRVYAAWLAEAARHSRSDQVWCPGFRRRLTARQGTRAPVRCRCQYSAPCGRSARR